MLMHQETFRGGSTLEESPLGDIPLTADQKKRVIYTKYESENPLVSDTLHQGEWHEQFVSDERLGLTEDDGCIVSFVGTRRGEVGITAAGEVLDQASADMREETMNTALPRLVAWDFTIARMEKTDGPEGRYKLHRSLDEKRKEGENDLVNSISSAFTQAVSSLQSAGTMSPSRAEIEEEILSSVKKGSK